MSSLLESHYPLTAAALDEAATRGFTVGAWVQRGGGITLIVKHDSTGAGSSIPVAPGYDRDYAAAVQFYARTGWCDTGRLGNVTGAAPAIPL